MRRALILTSILSAPALAADRTVAVGSFDRVRVDGAFTVRIATGRSPRARISGDARTLDGVELRTDGTTLRLRRRAGGVRPPAPATVVLETPNLRSIMVIGDSEITVQGMKTDRADLSVAGKGRIIVEGMTAEQATASVIGDARIQLAGRAGHVHLSTNGAGSVDATRLDADEVSVQLQGPGETLARARYTATVASIGAGRVTIAGKPKCTVRAPADSRVVCGTP